jgi:hypothetical protein
MARTVGAGEIGELKVVARGEGRSSAYSVAPTRITSDSQTEALVMAQSLDLR